MARTRNSRNRNNNKPTDNKRSNPKEESNGGKNSRKSKVAGAGDPGIPESTGDRSVEKQEEVDPKAKNDPEWYGKFPELLIAAANVAFSYPLGAPIEPWARGTKELYGIDISFPVDGYGYSNSGIVAITTVPTYGHADSFNDPLNTAAHMVYTQVRYRNSGRKNYDQADIMMYIICVSDLYSYAFWMKRIYNAAFMLSQRNYFYSELLKAMHVDPTSIVQNLAQFRSYINYFIARISTLVVPNTIELFKRRAFMYQGLYSESENLNVKDQMYMFIPGGFMKWGLDESSVSMCELKTMRYANSNASSNTPKTVDLDYIREFGEDLLSTIVGDEDFSIMSGDILRAFEGSLIGITPQEEEGVLLPIFDQYVLHQIKNATLVRNFQAGKSGFVGSRDTQLPNLDACRTYQVKKSLLGSEQKICYYGNVYQDGTGIIHYRGMSMYKYTYGTGSASLLDKTNLLNLTRDAILSLDEVEPDPAMIVEATRLTVMGGMHIYDDNGGAGPAGSANSGFELECGSDVAVYAEIYLYVPAADGTKDSKRPTLSRRILNSNLVLGSAAGDMPENVAIPTSQCRYIPIQFVHSFRGTSSGGNMLDTFEPVSDLKTWTMQSASIIQNITDVALLSLLSVPGVSKLYNG